MIGSRKPRSPVSGATVHEVEMLREAIRTVGAWERRIPYAILRFPPFFNNPVSGGVPVL